MTVKLTVAIVWKWPGRTARRRSAYDRKRIPKLAKR